MMKLYKIFSFFIFIACVFIALRIPSVDDSFPKSSVFVENNRIKSSSSSESLRIDYYKESCPIAEQIIRTTVAELYESKPDIAPAILRLVFHDCFPQGCDASVLLDSADGIETEKDAPPNRSLKHLDTIDVIKSKLEVACPGVVSCADVIVLAARESVVQAGGPFYALQTGRRDSMLPSIEKARKLPTPNDNHTTAIHSFASRGFDERETVALLGAHSVGKVHCQFFKNRFKSFHQTDKPDLSVATEFLETLRSTCNRSLLSSDAPSHPPSVSPSPSSSSASFSQLSEDNDAEPSMKMDYEGLRTGFGTIYYKSLLQRRGILFVDQQLTAHKKTKAWVRAYASNVSLFQREFASAMIKLSNLQVLTAPMGQVRLNCCRVN